MRKLAAGNWKMNGLRASLAEAEALLAAQPDPACEMLLCPPATLVAALAGIARGTALRVGGQDSHTAAIGAHTGDISAAMLADAGAGYVIVGHSERRADHGEDDALVCAKARAAQDNALIPIVCLGETEAERDAGRTLDLIAGQLASVPEGSSAAMLVVAYEPVWAIGTGRTASPEQAQAVHAVLRAQLQAATGRGDAMRILYGGSVKPDNAAELFAQPDIDGGLIGGAALKAADFIAIARAAG